jgi:hypothetical protein
MARGSNVLKVLSISAAVGYAMAIAIYVAPPRWILSPTVVFSLCPAALASFTVDPSAASVAFVLAPVNAVLYGIVGALCWLAYEEARTEICDYRRRRRGLSTGGKLE